MFKNLFSKNKEVPKTIELKAYATGKLVGIEEVPDPVFCRKDDGRRDCHYT
jgi:sugar PTS system EIIA component